MNWTSVTPKKAGYYWYRIGESEPSIVKLFKDEGEEWTIQYGNLDMPPTHPGYQFSWLQDWSDEGEKWAYIPTPNDKD